jgi:hypothetical protein
MRITDRNVVADLSFKQTVVFVEAPLQASVCDVVRNVCVALMIRSTQ